MEKCRFMNYESKLNYKNNNNNNDNENKNENYVYVYTYIGTYVPQCVCTIKEPTSQPAERETNEQGRKTSQCLV